MVKSFYSVLAAALAALLLAYCSKPTDPVTTHSPAVYTITYDGNGATSGTVPIDSTQYREGDILTVKGNIGGLAQDSKEFIGWAAEQGATESLYNKDDTFEISRSLILYAVWGGKPYNINFDKNHAGAGGTQASLAGQIWGTPITLPAATTFTPPAGMRFAGWAETSNGAAIQGAYRGPADHSAAVTFYAVWEGNSYAINFDKNHAGAGGSQTSLADQIWGAPITLPAATTFTPPANMNFAGWAETSDGAVIRGAYRGPGTYSAAVTLYAVWGGNPYAINFDKNHEGSGGSQTGLTNQNWGAPITLPAATTFAPPANMSFAGWAETSDGAVIQGAYRGPSTYSAAVTLYAVWEGDSYTINFDKNHAGAGGSQTSLADQIWKAPITLPAATTFTPPANMSFAGWAETSDGAVIQGTYPGPVIYSEDVTLYAVWRGDPYTINFNKNHEGSGGSQRGLTNQIWGAPITLPAVTFTPPTDMRFAGWAETPNGAVIRGAYRGPSTYSAAVTLYAVWGGSFYTINFDKNHAGAGGSQTNLTNQIWGVPIRLPAVTFTPPNDMRFAGWAEASGGAVIQGAYRGPGTYSAAVTLYAIWKDLIFGNREWQTIAMSSDGSKLAAAEYRGHLYTSANSGVAWTDRSGASSSTIAGNKRWQAIAMSSDGSKLAAVVYDGHLYTSADSGATWTDRSSAASSTITGNKRWQAIAMSSDGSKLAAVEYRGHLYTSTNSGAAWTDRSSAIQTIAGDKKWQAIAMSSDGSKLAAVEYRGHLYTSADSGAAWTDRSGASSSTIAGNKRWKAIAMSSDGSKLAAVEYSGYLYTSTNSGAAWTNRSTTTLTIAGKKKWQTIAMSSDGSKLAAAVGNDLPLVGGRLYTSANSGAAWTDRSSASSSTIAGNKRWQAIAMSSNGSKLAAMVRGGHLYASADSGATWEDLSRQ